MKLILNLDFTILLLAALAFFVKDDNGFIKSTKLLTNVQLVKADDGRLFTVQDSVGILYVNNYTIYQIPNIYTKTIVKADTAGNVLSEKEVQNETKFEYIIYRNNQNYGYKFDSIDAIKPRAVSIDSFQKHKLYKGFPFFKRANDSLLNTTYNSQMKMLTMEYIPKIRFDSSYPDTMNYSFRQEFNNIEYSFSKELDSLIKIKLTRVEFITNPTVVNNVPIPRRVLLFEIVNNTVDTAAILKFVARFKKEEPDLNKREKLTIKF